MCVREKIEKEKVSVNEVCFQSAVMQNLDNDTFGECTREKKDTDSA